MLTKNCLIWENIYALEEADIILLGVPFDSTSSEIPGTRFAPNRIREDFNISLCPYHEVLGDLSDAKLHDAGNLEVSHGNPKKTLEDLYNDVADIASLNPKAKIIALGGEHSITPPIFKALNRQSPLDYICYDSHWDLKDEAYGIKESHECANRRIFEAIGGERMQIRGASIGTKEEHAFSKKITGASSANEAYLSIDLDALKRVPVGCQAPEAMGLSELWSGVMKIGKIRAADVVEYNPMLGHSIIPAELVRRLILRMM